MTCTIRPWRLDDAVALAAILNNENIQNNLRDGIPYPYTEQDARDYLSSILQSDPNSTFAFAITADGAVAGSIGLFRQENIHCQTAELGYYVAEPLWGQGIGSAAVVQAGRHGLIHRYAKRGFIQLDEASFERGREHNYSIAIRF